MDFKSTIVPPVSTYKSITRKWESRRLNFTFFTPKKKTQFYQKNNRGFSPLPGVYPPLDNSMVQPPLWPRPMGKLSAHLPHPHSVNRRHLFPPVFPSFHDFSGKIPRLWQSCGITRPRFLTRGCSWVFKCLGTCDEFCDLNFK